LAIFNIPRQLSILAILNFGHFQAKILNGVQQEQQKLQQHLNCMDLAIKNTGPKILDLHSF
jgi:hypothetical protein